MPQCYSVTSGIYAYTTVYTTLPWGGFPSSIARQLRHRTTRTSSESSRRHVSSALPLRHRHHSSCGDIDHGRSTQGAVIHTVVHCNVTVKSRYIYVSSCTICFYFSSHHIVELFAYLCVRTCYTFLLFLEVQQQRQTIFVHI